MTFMHKQIIQFPEIKLVGITARTNNANEMKPETGKIPSMIQKYFHGGLSEKIMTRKNPGTTYCVYTNYESDVTGDYTYFIGEEVTSLEGVPEGFETIAIPAQNYAKFTNQPGPMPAVCIGMWKNIWAMKPSDLGGDRSYIADFEVYDNRSADQNNAVLDIYIGLRG
jgi:predicted transcriptional regulator YdeE